MDHLVTALQNSLSGGTGTETFTPTPVLVVDDFLPADHLEAVSSWLVGQGDHFTASKVMSSLDARESEDVSFRRSKVMFESGPVRVLFERRLLGAVDAVRQRLSLPGLPVTDIELQVTASNDGDFFKCHTDNGRGPVASRSLTFVYFVHREPRPYDGGHLMLYETTSTEHGNPVSGEKLADVEPVRNRMVFFPSHLMHEVGTVHCPSQAFADSRFTINGWYRTSVRSAAHRRRRALDRQAAGRPPTVRWT